jgi:hypothetical protein
MTPRKRRILWQSVLVGLAAALIDYGLVRLYQPAVRVFVDVGKSNPVEGGDGVAWRGPLLFGLLAFALAAALEGIRGEKPPKGQPG